MSELQIALIAIGAVIIIAVLLINWWQERRFHKQVEKSFSPLQRDALLDDNASGDPEFTQPIKVREPKFDQSEFNASLNSDLDNRATEHFTLDEARLVGKPSADAESESSDRFVPLPNENNADLVMREEESTDETYNEILSTKLDKFSASLSHADNDQECAKNTVVSEGEEKQSSEFKAVFDDAGYQNQEIPTLQVTQNIQSEDITPPLEIPVSLPEMLHGQIDLTALLYLSSVVPVRAVNQALASLFDHFDKPIFVHVLDSNNVWHLLKDLQSNQEALNRQISKVACSIQLADRGGAIERTALNRFHLAVETLGLDINGHVEWQNAGDALSAANSLDLFCIEVDKTIGFHLVHGENGPFTGTKLRGLAEAQGLILASDGTFKFFDASGDQASTTKSSLAKPEPHPSFVMFNRDDHPFNPEMLRSSVVKGITFQLDIPHVKQSAETFSQMIQVAKQMEIGLNAVLVDANNKVLGDIQIEKIRQQLKGLQATMLVRGIVPGSDSAHRLFS